MQIREIVLLPDGMVYSSYARGARACTKFSMRCDGAEMNIIRRRTPARATSAAAVIYHEKRCFIIPTGVLVRHGSKSVYIPLTAVHSCR